MSTEMQLQGDSARRQIAATEAYAKQRGWELVEVLFDPGKSAFRGKNIEFGAALARFRELIDTGRVEKGSYLIVESMDRLTRQNIAKAFDLLRDIVSRGVIVVTLDDRQEYSQASFNSMGDIFVALGSMMRGHQESMRKSERVGAAWSEKKRLAAAEHKFVTRKMPAWLFYNEATNQIEPIPERVAIVQDIFEKLCTGWGAYSITRDLNSRRVPVWSTKPRAVWRESYIKKLVASRTVLGEYQPRRLDYGETTVAKRVPDGAPILGYYPQIISEDRHSQAINSMAQRRTTGSGRKGKNYANIFTGLLTCGLCGAGIRYIDKGAPPKGGIYLKCSVSDSRGRCQAPSWRYRLIEENLLQAMDTLDVSYVLEGRTREQAIEECRVEVERAQREVQHLCEVIERTAQAVRSGSATPPAVLVTMLERDEASHTKAVEAYNAKLDQLASLEQFDPIAQRERLDGLVGTLREYTGSIEGVDVRRALASELRHMLRKIIIRPVRRSAWETIEEKPLWLNPRITQAELQEMMDRLNFEIVFVYRNGREQHLDPISEEYFEFYNNWRLELLRATAGTKSKKGGIK